MTTADAKLAHSDGATLSRVSDANLTAALSDGADLIASGNLDDKTLNKSGKGVVEKYFGFIPDGDSFLEAFIQILGAKAHPDGELGPRPVMPDSQGRLRMSHSVEGSGRENLLFVPPRFSLNPLADNGFFTTVSHYRDCQKRGLKETLDKNVKLGRKVAGYELRKLGIAEKDFTEYSPLLMPREHKDEVAESPETSYTDDCSTLTNWTNVAGTWGNSSGQIVLSGDNVESALRYNSALSGGDQTCYASVTWRDTGSTIAGVAARFSASAHTCYFFGGAAVTDDIRIGRVVTGTRFNTWVVSSITIGAETLVSECTINGSNLRGVIYKSPSQMIEIVDTNVSSSNLRGGLMGFANAGVNDAFFDNFVLFDIEDYPRERLELMMVGN